jgi:hypothetical protein
MEEWFARIGERVPTLCLYGVQLTRTLQEQSLPPVDASKDFGCYCLRHFRATPKGSFGHEIAGR